MIFYCKKREMGEISNEGKKQDDQEYEQIVKEAQISKNIFF